MVCDVTVEVVLNLEVFFTLVKIPNTVQYSIIHLTCCHSIKSLASQPMTLEVGIMTLVFLGLGRLPTKHSTAFIYDDLFIISIYKEIILTREYKLCNRAFEDVHCSLKIYYVTSF
jgi:hypothetical protein